MAIQHMSDGKWFHPEDDLRWLGGGTNWMNPSNFSSGTSATWNYTDLTNGDLQTGTSYYVIVKARDIAGNLETDTASGSDAWPACLIRRSPSKIICSERTGCIGPPINLPAAFAKVAHSLNR